mmetsp:Transcript_4438/g.14386  ORF Transcript_4438/g.14386 Transcript_4438/m.14386 type:complete len:151 (-) Transcript_4438:167-619(-)
MAALVAKGQSDLVEHIDWSQVQCLNEVPSHTYVNAAKAGYREDDGLYLESDTDEQLLMHIPFTKMVKLHSLIIKAPQDGTGPKTVKIFVNAPSMGFSDASDVVPADVIELSGGDLMGEKPILLKYVKFQNVKSIDVFVEDNQEDEETTKI